MLPMIDFNIGSVGQSVTHVYEYLVWNVFGFHPGVESSIIVARIVSMLSYWTIVSIIYLIFDVLMYVPLLVHRWIDKARLE